MTNLTEHSSFDKVYQLETSDRALGGPSSVMNRQAQALANRTRYLKDAADNTKQELSEFKGLVKKDYALKTELIPAPITQVNGKAGNVTLTASDVGALTETQADAKYLYKSEAKNIADALLKSKGGTVTGDINFTGKLQKNGVGVASVNELSEFKYLVKKDYALKTELIPAPITQVNGKTGNVTLIASDVGALTETQADAKYLYKSEGKNIADALLKSKGGTVTRDINFTGKLQKNGVGFASVNEVIGVGQKWVDKLSSRRLGVEYVNQTGRPIMVSVSLRGRDPYLLAFVDSVQVAINNNIYNTLGCRTNLTLIIPNGSKYLIKTIDRFPSEVEVWSELT